MRFHGTIFNIDIKVKYLVKFFAKANRNQIHITEPNKVNAVCDLFYLHSPASCKHRRNVI